MTFSSSTVVSFEEIEKWYETGYKRFMLNDSKEARYYFKLAAQYGHVSANYYLHKILDKTNPKLSLDINAMENYIQAIEQKHSTEYNKLALLYEAAALLDHAPSQVKIGNMYLHGTCVTQNRKIAFEYYTKAMKQGDPMAELTIAYMFENGLGIAKDVKKAASIYKNLIERFEKENISLLITPPEYYINALLTLGKLLIGHAEFQGNKDTAIKYFHKAAEAGHPSALYYLGVIYEEGYGIPRDEAEAYKYFKMAADAEESPSIQYKVSTMLMRGIGVKQDEKKAVHYLNLSAAQNHEPALYELYLRHDVGRGVSQDKIKAANILKKLTYMPNEDPLPQFILKNKLTNNLMTSSALQIKIYLQVNNQVMFNYLFDLVSVAELKKSYVPLTPPPAKNQRGSNCIIYSFGIGCGWGNPKINFLPIRKNEIFPNYAEKKLKNEKEGPKSLREMAKKFDTVIGGSIETVAKVAKQLKVDSEKIICHKDKIIKMFIDTIQAKNSIIITFCVARNGFPAATKEDIVGDHAALLFGYIYMEDEYHFIATHWGKYFLFSAKKLLDSLLEFRMKAVSASVASPRKFVKCKNVDSYVPLDTLHYVPDEKDIRIETIEYASQKLGVNMYEFLRIRTTEKNIFATTLPKVADEKDIYGAVAKHDAIMLKLLLETVPDFKLEKYPRVWALAEKNQTDDPFCLQVLLEANYNSSKIIDKQENETAKPNNRI